MIESKITEFLDIRHEGYEEALQTASDDLASAKEKLDDLERRMRELLESG